MILKIKNFIPEAKWTSSKSQPQPPQLSTWFNFPAFLSEAFFQCFAEAFCSAYSSSASTTNYFLLVCQLRAEPESTKPPDEFGILLIALFCVSSSRKQCKKIFRCGRGKDVLSAWCG